MLMQCNFATRRPSFFRSSPDNLCRKAPCRTTRARLSTCTCLASGQSTLPAADRMEAAWTHKLITAKDHASIQINIGHLNADGTYNGQFTTFALTGKVRSMGEADAALDLLWKRKQAESS
ncbi:hypothetical protein QJQ45_028004 [Haematococcus lacustris]|nr:hypothetical protein QJQ45_028004 [Haematococcus lacustris]